MPQEIPLQVRPYDIQEYELASSPLPDVWEALIKTKAWDTLIDLASSKTSVESEASRLAAMQNEAFLQGRLNLALELLGITEMDLYGSAPASSQADKDTPDSSSF